MNILHNITGDIVEILPKLLEIFQKYIITNFMNSYVKKESIPPVQDY